MRKFLLAASTASICMSGASHAAMLRPFSQIAAPTVRLGDLFADLGSTPDRVLGRAPAPGERILVGAPQLAAIARDFNVDWRPASGSEQAVIERRGDTLQRAVILDALRKELVAGGAPEGSEISMPDLQPVIVPAGTRPAVDVSQCSYEPGSGHFTALVAVSSPDMPEVQMRLSGAVIVLATAAVPTRQLARGAVIGAADVQITRVRISLLHGDAPLPPDEAAGMVLKHAVAAGQPLRLLDVAKPDLVMRGSLVSMTLRSDGIALVAEGIAKESGGRGDHVHIENPNSHTIVDAEVIGPDAVRVAPRPAAITLVAAQ